MTHQSIRKRLMTLGRLSLAAGLLIAACGFASANVPVIAVGATITCSSAYVLIYSQIGSL